MSVEHRAVQTSVTWRDSNTANDSGSALIAGHAAVFNREDND
jgi:hypothetical protein